MTRELMQEYTAEILAEQRRTVLFITTDVDEALLLADRLLITTERPARVREEFAMTGPALATARTCCTTTGCNTSSTAR